MPPPGLTTGRGTAVRLMLTNPLSPLLDAGYVEETIRRHFEPLIDPAFDDLLRRHYPNRIAFEVDGREVTHVDVSASERAPVAIRSARTNVNGWDGSGRTGVSVLMHRRFMNRKCGRKRAIACGLEFAVCRERRLGMNVKHLVSAGAVALLTTAQATQQAIDKMFTNFPPGSAMARAQ
jgi:hypothetical protein